MTTRVGGITRRVTYTYNGERRQADFHAPASEPAPTTRGILMVLAALHGTTLDAFLVEKVRVHGVEIVNEEGRGSMADDASDTTFHVEESGRGEYHRWMVIRRHNNSNGYEVASFKTLDVAAEVMRVMAQAVKLDEELSVLLERQKRENGTS